MSQLRRILNAGTLQFPYSSALVFCENIRSRFEKRSGCRHLPLSWPHLLPSYPFLPFEVRQGKHGRHDLVTEHQTSFVARELAVRQQGCSATLQGLVGESKVTKHMWQRLGVVLNILCGTGIVGVLRARLSVGPAALPRLQLVWQGDMGRSAFGEESWMVFIRVKGACIKDACLLHQTSKGYTRK